MMQIYKNSKNSQKHCLNYAHPIIIGCATFSVKGNPMDSMWFRKAYSIEWCDKKISPVI